MRHLENEFLSTPIAESKLAGGKSHYLATAQFLCKTLTEHPRNYRRHGKNKSKIQNEDVEVEELVCLETYHMLMSQLDVGKPGSKAPTRPSEPSTDSSPGGPTALETKRDNSGVIEGM
jgi:hypothetical protein